MELRSRGAALRRTRNSAYGSLGRKKARSRGFVRPAKGNIVTFEFSAVPSAPAGFVTADDFLSKMKSNPEIARRLPAARARLESLSTGKPTLVRLRLRLGLSQAELATAIGSNQPAISAYESGAREPSLGVASKLARTLNVSLDELAGAFTHD